MAAVPNTPEKTGSCRSARELQRPEGAGLGSRESEGSCGWDPEPLFQELSQDCFESLPCHIRT